MYYLVDEIYRIPFPNSDAYLDANTFNEEGLRHKAAEAFAQRFLSELDPLPDLESITITTNWFEDFISWIGINDLLELISREPGLSVFTGKSKALQYLDSNPKILMKEMFDED